MGHLFIRIELKSFEGLSVMIEATLHKIAEHILNAMAREVLTQAV